MSYPPHWRGAIRELGVNRSLNVVSDAKGRLLMRYPRARRASHLILDIRGDPAMRPGTWAATSLFIDGPLRTDLVRQQFGLPKSVKIRDNVWIKYVSLSPSPIPKRDFHVRYPDVPYELAHTFVLMHELGHAVKGWKEAAADRYAFRRMMLPEDPKAKKLRDAVYGKMRHPGSFMGWPNR